MKEWMMILFWEEKTTESIDAHRRQQQLGRVADDTELFLNVFGALFSPLRRSNRIMDKFCVYSCLKTGETFGVGPDDVTTTTITVYFRPLYRHGPRVVVEVGAGSSAT